jgi:hypothetical protein
MQTQQYIPPVVVQATPAPAVGGGGAKFCSNCGARGVGTAFCQECGTRV